MLYLKNERIKEASGICRSLRNKTDYYTHEDSGNLPYIFGFNELGDNLGTIVMSGKSLDNEDISSAVINGLPTIILADIGDNSLVRTSFTIRVVIEPEAITPALVPYSQINFKYPDGFHNAEACALLDDGRIIIVTKNYPRGNTGVYVLESSLSGASSTICTKIKDLSVGTVTGMDLSADQTEMVVLANGYAHFFSWPSLAFKRKVKLPIMYQPEGICYSHAGNSLLVCSETNKTTGARTPLYSVPI